jgi:hypothetical protein
LSLYSQIMSTGSSSSSSDPPGPAPMLVKWAAAIFSNEDNAKAAVNMDLSSSLDLGKLSREDPPKTLIQGHDALKLMEPFEASRSGAVDPILVFDESLTHHMKAWWTNHHNAESMRALMMALGIWALAKKGTTKREMIEHCLDKAVLPVLFTDVSLWVDAVKALEVANANDGLQEHHASEGEAGDHSSAAAAQLAAQAPAAQALAAQAKLDAAGSAPVSMAQVMAMLTSVMQPIATAMKANMRPTSEKSSEKKDDGEGKPLYEIRIEKARKSLHNGYFVDPMKFSWKRRADLRAQTREEKQIVLTERGVRNMHVGPSDNSPKDYDPEAFEQGLNFIFLLMLEDPSLSHGIQDWHKWRMTVWEYPASGSKRVKYMKDFLQKYSASEYRGKYCALHNSDHALLKTFNQVTAHEPEVQPKRTRAGARSRSLSPHRGRSRSPYRSRKRARGDNTHHRDGRKSGNGAPNASRPHDFCMSRVDRAKKECRFKDRCKFSHSCASCGRDHLAKDCRNWNGDKVRAAIGK